MNRCGAAETITLLARGVVYLVNYPDGTQTAHSCRGGVEIMRNGDEPLDGWLVDRIRRAKAGSYTKDGLPIIFEIWVEPKVPDGGLPRDGEGHYPRIDQREM